MRGPAAQPAPNNLARQYASWGRLPRTAVSDLTGASRTSAGWLLYLLFAYAIAVGPANYLALRRLGHLGSSLATAPLAPLTSEEYQALFA